MTAPYNTDASFGSFALPRWLEALRASADTWPRRFLCSGLRRLIVRFFPGPCDVTVFGTQKARLHATDNRAEKRVLCGTQFWDKIERQALADALSSHKADRPFCFVDAGANVGLYSLSLRADALKQGVEVKIIAVEPDPENARRLSFNVQSSEAKNIAIVNAALSASQGTLKLATGQVANRGEVRVAKAEDDQSQVIEVPALPLLDVISSHGFAAVDAMKMDIEGFEVPVLEAFFKTADQALWPKLIVMETGRSQNPLFALVQSHGYRVEKRVGINTLFVRAEQHQLPDVDTP